MIFKNRFIFSVAIFSFLAAAVTILWLIAFWKGMGPVQESLFTHVLRERFAVVFIAVFFSICALALILGALLHYYLIPLKKLAEETALISTVNPSHRIHIQGSKDIIYLAEAINEGAVRFQRLQCTVQEKIREAKQREMEERHILGTIVSRLSEGVLLCNNDGMICLYNGRSKALLSPNGGEEGNGDRVEGIVGLGRSVFDVLHKKTLQSAFQALDQQIESGRRFPSFTCVTASRSGRALRLKLYPVLAWGNKRDGFVIMCDDLTKEQDAEFGPSEISTSLNLLPPRVSFQSGSQGDRPHVMETNRPEFYDFDLFKQRRDMIAQKNRRLIDLNYTAFDTETTGLDPVGGDEIISIGAVRIINGRILRGETFDQLIDPKWFMRPEVIRIHGITPERLEGQPTIDAVLPRFHAFVGDTVLVGHNVAFDMRFFQLKEEKTGVRFVNPVLDTLLLSAVVHPHQETHSLEAIAERMGLNVVGRHTALGDAMLTANIFNRLIRLLKNKGIQTLGEATTASRQTYFGRLQY